MGSSRDRVVRRRRVQEMGNSREDEFTRLGVQEKHGS